MTGTDDYTAFGVDCLKCVIHCGGFVKPNNVLQIASVSIHCDQSHILSRKYKCAVGKYSNGSMFSLVALYHCRNCFTSWPSGPPASSPGDWLQNTEYRLLRSACLLRQALVGSWILRQQHQQSSSGEWYLKSFCFCAVFCSIQFQPSFITS